MTKKIGVLMGGLSREREISLKTGKAVLDSIQRTGHDAVSIDCGTDLPARLRSEGIEVAFVCLHGPLGEDGCVQGLLEWMRIPYTGSGVMASALAMDKAVLNSLGQGLGFLRPKEIVFDSRFETMEALLSRLRHGFGFGWPVIVKPSREGSTINTTIVREFEGMEGALRQALQSDTKVLVEEFIKGQEVTVALLNGKALPSIEIVPQSGFYDYQSKYTKGKTDYILPARITRECQSELNRVSEKIGRAIDCEGVVRADFIISDPGRKPYFLEVNTIPGMTETSLVPKAAAHAGISFDDLCRKILEGASLKANLKTL